MADTPAEFREWLKEVIGTESPRTLAVLAEEEIVSKDELAQHWLELRDKMPIKVRDKLKKHIVPPSVKPLCPWVIQIPVLNVVFDFVESESPPSLANVKDAMNAMGLLAALALTVSMALPASVNFEQIKLDAQRFARPPYSGVLPVWEGYFNISEPADLPEALIEQLAEGTITSTALLASAVIVVVIFLIVIGTTGGEVFDEDYEAYKSWYAWTRWLVVWVFTCLVTGMTYAFRSYIYLVIINFPDFYVEKEGEINYWAGYVSPYGLVFNTIYFLVIAPTIISFVILGLGHRKMLLNIREGSRRTQTYVIAAPSRDSRAELSSFSHT
jgi:hypothetical protein